MAMCFREKDRGAAQSGPRSLLGKPTAMLTAACCVAALCWWLGQTVLVVRSEGGVARSWRVATGTHWQLQYTHSVEKTPVEECFTVVAPGKLVLYATRYRSYGVGLPSLTGDGVFVQHDGYFELKMDRAFQQVKFRAGLEARPELLINGNLEPLYQHYQPGSLMVFTVEKRWRYYWNWMMEKRRGQI